MFKITAPEKSYNGVSSNIAFVNGVAIAELDPFTREWFLSKGYSLEEIKQEKPKTTPEAGNPETGENVKEPTKAELTARAEELGIEIKGKLTNNQIKELIANKEAELKALEDKDPEAGNPETGENGDPEKGE